MPESDSIKRERLRLAKTYKSHSLRTWSETKETLSHEWIENRLTHKGRQILRGGIYMCHLGDNIGDEHGKHRPVLVVSNELINKTSGNVSVVPLTTKLKKKAIIDPQTKRVIKYLDKPRYKSHYFLWKSKYGFLDDNSATVCEEVKTVSKVRLGKHKGDISPTDLNKVLRCIDWVVGLR